MHADGNMLVLGAHTDRYRICKNWWAVVRSYACLLAVQEISILTKTPGGDRNSDMSEFGPSQPINLARQMPMTGHSKSAFSPNVA